MRDCILARLPQDHPWRPHIQWFDTLASTNDLAKALARQGAPHGTVLIADRQTGGRGRLGRSFHSPGGTGIYMSVLLRPQCSPGALMHLTCAVAEAMCDAVQTAAGIRPGIKWINDLVYEGRKLGGILTELVLTPTGELDGAVIGVGINCCQQPGEFPPELQGIATSLAAVTERQPDRAALAAAMIAAFSAMADSLLTGQEAMLERYRRDCITLGKDIQVLRQGLPQPAKALDIDGEGALVVRWPDGTVASVSSGEVSVRGMYGYV